MNDGNILDSRNFHQSLHNGTFENNDFLFEVGSKVFNKLWFLLDGIYHELSHFVKMISELLDVWKALYYFIWQEAKRKVIGQGFGVLKKKFRFYTILLLKTLQREFIVALYCATWQWRNEYYHPMISQNLQIFMNVSILKTALR
jgi:hypothetical protein